MGDRYGCKGTQAPLGRVGAVPPPAVRATRPRRVCPFLPRDSGDRDNSARGGGHGGRILPRTDPRQCRACGTVAGSSLCGRGRPRRLRSLVAARVGTGVDAAAEPFARDGCAGEPSRCGLGTHRRRNPLHGVARLSPGCGQISDGDAAMPPPMDAARGDRSGRVQSRSIRQRRSSHRRTLDSPRHRHRARRHPQCAHS